DSEENQVGGFYPGAMTDSQDLGLTAWKDQDPLMVISAHDPAAMARQVAECRKWDLHLCYDVGQQVTNLPVNDMIDGIKAAKVLIVNEYEMDTLAARTNMDIEIIKNTVPVVITTFGKRGSVIEGVTVQKPIKMEIVKADQVVDPTGAGDSYRGGFFYGYSRGWDLEVCAGLGATCAAYTIEQHGTQGHSFTLEQAAQRYKAHFKQALPHS
ncbi:MAG TPA: PfkB family carbohydrate kinase, partial [Candidatus Polarisedimenticolaceae bacterium]|nr:PfkB family carbohydrate kinase [Candidatus Polarisedimenticolaceae bacterium]